MTTPRERIQQDVKTAMKARDTERLPTLRMLLTDLQNEKIKNGREVDEDGFVAVVRRGIKQRKDAADGFRAGGREESALQEEAEAEILAEYLPAQADESEVRRSIEELAEAQNLAGPKDLGKVMGPTLQRFGGSTDGATVQRIAREVLAERAEREG
jgi:uncharacterized protein